MSSIFNSGTSGRVQDIAIASSSTTDMPPGFGDNTAVLSPLPTATPAAEIQSWNFQDGTQSEPIYTFEGPANAAGVVYPVHTRGGLSPGAKIDISGVFDRSATKSSARFVNGGYVLADCIIFKPTGFGYLHMVCKVTNYKHGADASAKAQSFTCTLEVQGVPPAPSLPS